MVSIVVATVDNYVSELVVEEFLGRSGMSFISSMSDVVELPYVHRYAFFPKGSRQVAGLEPQRDGIRLLSNLEGYASYKDLSKLLGVTASEFGVSSSDVLKGVTFLELGSYLVSRGIIPKISLEGVSEPKLLSYGLNSKIRVSKPAEGTDLYLGEPVGRVIQMAFEGKRYFPLDLIEGYVALKEATGIGDFFKFVTRQELVALKDMGLF